MRSFDEEMRHRGYLGENERSGSRFGLMVAAFLLLLASGGMLYLNLRDRKESLTPDMHTIQRNYDKKIKLLEDTKRNLQELTEYLTNQSIIMNSTGQLLTEMQNQRDKLRPLLNTEVEAVNALFQAQEERLSKGRAWENFISIVLGILSGIATNILWPTIRRWLRHAVGN